MVAPLIAPHGGIVKRRTQHFGGVCLERIVIEEITTNVSWPAFAGHDTWFGCIKLKAAHSKARLPVPVWNRQARSGGWRREIRRGDVEQVGGAGDVDDVVGARRVERV